MFMKLFTPLFNQFYQPENEEDEPDKAMLILFSVFFSIVYFVVLFFIITSNL